MIWLFLIPLLTGIITQLIKLIVDITQRRFSFKNIFSYGGMPSAHTATVVSLCMIVAKNSGIESSAFTIAFLFSTFVIWDAIGLREKIGMHSKILNMLIKDTVSQKQEGYSYLDIKTGHTPFEVFIGGLVGAIITYFIW